MKFLRRLIARRKLQRIVEANKASPAHRDYTRRRTAALKGLQKT